MTGPDHDEKRPLPDGGKASERAEARERAGKERRSAHRVADDQGSGQGSLTALSRFKMIERRKRLFGRHQDEPFDEPPW